MKNIITLLFFVAITQQCGFAQQNEVEPNGSFAAANYFGSSIQVMGTIGCSGDVSDFFVTNLPSDGTIRIYLERTNTSLNNSQYFYFKLMDKNQSQVYYDYNGYVNSGMTRYDTLNFPCRAKDTMYFQMTNASACFQYKIKYEIINYTPLHIDTAGNETFANAIYFNATDSIVGKIKYTANTGTGGTDQDDYFKSYIPSDGTLRVYLERKNTSSSNSQYVYFQLLDKNQSLVYQHFPGYLNPGVTKYDTLDFPCRAKDTMYFQMTGATACFQYKVKYEMINNIPLHIDTAGNETFANAIYFNATDSIIGKIKYTAHSGTGGTDQDDYFKSYIPSDGTLRVYLESKNTSSSNSQYVYFQLLDKNQSQVYQHFPGYLNPGVTKYDTLDFYCTAKDTFYFRMTGATACFQYKIKYEMINYTPLHIDTAGNESFANAIYFNATDSIVGKIRYTAHSGAGGTDQDDYFKSYIPSDGTLRVYLESKNTSSSNYQYVYFQLLDKNQSQVYQHFPGHLNPGVTKYDTLDFYCTARDTFYFRMTGATACFQYKIKYEVTLGADISTMVCPGFTTDISMFYNTAPFNIVNWTNMGGGAMPPLTSVPNGVYRLTVEKTGIACSKDTAFVTVGLHPKPNLGNDTVANVCPGFTTDLTQFKNTINLTTQWLGTSTPAAVGAGTYTLIATNSFGCMDTVVITIGLHNGINLGNDTILHAWLGDTVNFATIIDTTGFAGMGRTHNWTSNIFGNSGYTIAIMNAADTITATIIATNQYGCSDTATETIYPVVSILPAIGVTNLTANAEVMDTSGWTHYYYTNNSSNKADDILLLSLKKNGNSIGNIGSTGFAVKNSATINAGNNLGVHITSPLVSNSTNYYAMHRFWEVTPTTQPTSAVGVRFYFNTQDYNDVNGSFSNLKSMQDLILYHLLNGNPDPSTNWAGATLPVISIMHSTQPTDTTWVLGSITNNGHFAEFKVNSFSGGGAGFTGNNLPLPIKLTKLTGTTKGLNSELNWESNQEDNILNYTLQRSEDGIIFNSLETFSTQNSTKNNYHYTDVNAGRVNKKLYYRLLIKEKNSQSYYSEVIILNFENIRNNYILFPNPSNGTITVTGVGAFTNYHIIDAHSKLVMSGNILSDLLSVDISRLADGSYYILLFHKNGNTASLQFTKKE